MPRADNVPASPFADLNPLASKNSPKIGSGRGLNGLSPIKTQPSDDQFEQLQPGGNSQGQKLATPPAASSPSTATSSPTSYRGGNLEALQGSRERLGQLTYRLAVKTGWTLDGTMKGLQMGLAFGIGMGLFATLCGQPHFAIALVILSPIVGLIVGAVAQAKARKTIKDEGEALQTELKSFITAGGAPEDPTYAKAKAMFDGASEGSVIKDIGNIALRVMGPLGVKLRAKAAEMQQQMEAKLKEAQQARGEATAGSQQPSEVEMEPILRNE